MSDTPPAPPLARTPLHALHLELGARMVPFAGYEMPVQYPPGIIKEHQHTRTAAGLFDVSHMGQIRISGPGSAAALEALMPTDVVELGINRQRYGLFTNEEGGILDDLMIANFGDHLQLVVNAACKQRDFDHLRTHLADRCEIAQLDDRALLALQGPKAGAVLARIAPETTRMTFMSIATAALAGAPCYVSRSGYTGEDVFEISVPADRAEALALLLLSQPEVAPAGLGARDSLRLEAGLCLYGHDIDAQTTPVEAGLGWALSAARREGGVRAGGYPGASVLAQELKEGAARKRVGLLPKGRMPVREGAGLVDGKGRGTGIVTSGGFGPTTGTPVAMGYLETALARVGSELRAVVRGLPVAVEVVALPFVPHRYYRG